MKATLTDVIVQCCHFSINFILNTTITNSQFMFQVRKTLILLTECTSCFFFNKDTTHARLIQELSTHALPLMWDDVSNLHQLESIALMCYNRVRHSIIAVKGGLLTWDY